ncbi:hypothetical protein [Elizabethkingia anophelis]|uniref:Uncharacterized protein n=1 Tax=Elizabethkingia anophelis TaxID=1117645 RepID=A0A455ZDF7_9FLAO|nr:hypothetical protein [Elizabethkingia anophelis]AQW91582.1 hypothetical protein BBD28_13395 [Elizabethkingia anophelis]KUY18531.1 hypothetical protein ATB94_03510 [Elizabethkingia anophelis]MCT3631894.1 hypothetical protein [Elizabethkingia anophelis]MCT3635408.1 hypothetical protein [Elizabethkingia anophelis]MCT3832135.1 hypothetical protein [Elizabethkingia anophelis]
MKINPLIIFNILIVLFLLIGVVITVLMIRNGMNIYYILAAGLSNLLLLFILYSLNKGIPSSHRVINKIQKNKERLEFNEKELIITTPIMEYKKFVEWDIIEAVYCLNIIPLEGTYHNFEYSIFLTQPARIVKYSKQPWYNRLFTSENNSIEIKINDYNNIDFNKLHPAIEKYLLKEEMEPDYLHKKFGNNTLANLPENKPLKSHELYKIYDRDNSTNNEKLREYRTEI